MTPIVRRVRRRPRGGWKPVRQLVITLERGTIIRVLLVLLRHPHIHGKWSSRLGSRLSNISLLVYPRSRCFNCCIHIPFEKQTPHGFRWNVKSSSSSPNSVGPFFEVVGGELMMNACEAIRPIAVPILIIAWMSRT